MMKRLTSRPLFLSLSWDLNVVKKKNEDKKCEEGKRNEKKIIHPYNEVLAVENVRTTAQRTKRASASVCVCGIDQSENRER